MADPTRFPSKGTLASELARVLPDGIAFTAHHISTPPTVTEPLCYPPAYPANAHDGRIDTLADVRARKPLKTYCEKQFLALSIPVPHTKDAVLALALEIYIYTTAHSSIIFVAKADSTGYLGLLDLPKGTPSPIREVTTAFVSYLIAHRKRRGVQFIVNLFARAQSQYLFPGSVKNAGKHILDDTGLVKWWCRVLNPLLEDGVRARSWGSIHGYLVIPGLDDYETRAFLPRVPSASSNWTLRHPLERISPYIADPITYGSNIPVRCLIPTYPDDPKARFVEELEESTSERAKLVGGWKSPKTLGQFWEMMAFRQECSSGRLTGFIWLVFDPASSSRRTAATDATARSAAAFIQTPNASFSAAPESAPAARPLTPERSQGLEAMTTPSASQATPVKPKPKRPRKRKVLRGRIIPRQPRIKTHQRAHFPKETETAYYSWPEEGRGQVILDESGYKRAVELLLHLEFGTLEQAITSSTRWINEVNVGKDWATTVIGIRAIPVQHTARSGTGTINDLSGMIKKKRPATDTVLDASTAPASSGAAINTLPSGLVRKKVKVTTEAPVSAPPMSDAPQVNTLGAGLVRKKPKAI
ncbi:hypothetical protein JX265_013564 [Neoarthrinium moseri]|uniref:histone acetyltransferase n=1 Tax=Neoarthrinium moseri TaxID=1658444 RepID=A0A9P9W8D2_9PEZI|nr:hypothetical protein JX265_013564 [Neoarthrinium moseri]